MSFNISPVSSVAKQSFPFSPDSLIVSALGVIRRIWLSILAPVALFCSHRDSGRRCRRSPAIQTVSFGPGSLLAISLPIPAEMLAISSYPAIIPKADNPATTILISCLNGLGNFLRRLALPKRVREWSLRTLRVILIKIGAKVVKHARYVTFQMAEVLLSKGLFQEILERIHRLEPAGIGYD